MRFLQLDNGPDPVFGRLTHIRRTTPTGYHYPFFTGWLLPPSFPRSAPQLPNRNLDVSSVLRRADGVPHDTAIRPFAADCLRGGMKSQDSHPCQLGDIGGRRVFCFFVNHWRAKVAGSDASQLIIDKKGKGQFLACWCSGFNAF